MAAASTENFYKAELNRTMRENAFGLKSWTMIPASSTADELHSAVVRVELLEGMTVYIRLTYVGYEIIADPSTQESQSPQMEISESLDELLRALSPAFNQAYTEKLMTRLNRVLVH
ncbi:hypothetical protein PIIN_04143 [Serendipita indica DSM 11827]|uniref:GSKIP domain-containing protein n=1 Tax=Serendipita indica (strain DSM 11827) TaxID=1109443 RepID=G4TFW1_SERID|nr:hypothetical protein PIIN_04143 [Serendipita indica DSM 11827]